MDQQLAQRRERVRELKTLVATNKQLLKEESERLNRLLIDGPFDMAYAIAEGTPHDVPLQLRGEPTMRVRSCRVALFACWVVRCPSDSKEADDCSWPDG